MFEEFEKKEFTKDNVFSLKHLRFIAHLNLEEQGDHFETIQNLNFKSMMSNQRRAISNVGSSFALST